MRCFRIGIATANSPATPCNSPVPVISNATRLEKGGVTGESRVSTALQGFPRSIQRLYGGEEEIRGKKHEKPQNGHRCVVVPRPPGMSR